MSGQLPFGRSVGLPDAECQGKCLLDAVCHGEARPDEQCQGICHLDTVRAF